MSVKYLIAMGAMVGGVFFLSAGPVQAQTSQVPNPPPEVCVNGHCVSTAAAPSGGTQPQQPSPPTPGTPSQHTIKWNPGHYMASDGVIYHGTPAGNFNGEMDDLNNQDAILGYRVYISWSALEPSMGNYDFSTLDAILARLKTAYNKPKRLVIMLWLYGQHALRPSDTRVIPLYIQQSAAYGASPVSGSYGWWGKSANGASTGMYAAALYRQPVMDRLIALVQALGQHYDREPYFEAIEIMEDATVAEAAGAWPPADPSYSDNAWLVQLERLLTASTAAFPHTSVIMDNSWFDRPAAGVALEQWMASNRVAPGTSDCMGQSAFDSYGTSIVSDGIKTYLGVDPYGGTTDLRPKMRGMFAVEGTELAGGYFAKEGGPFSPADLLDALNQTYQASHVFWTHFTGTENFGYPIPAAAVWPNLAATVSAHPLIHTDYPSEYPP